MKLTLNWLRDFVDLPTSDPEVLREVFDNLGYEVEEMAELLPSFRGVVIGRVESIAAHPDADKIRVCQVDVGGEVLEIICGAWNFDEGAVVPVAVPGAMLGGEFEITRREIRGVVSNGMICSEQELEIGEDSAGIMVLNADYPEAAQRIGQDFAGLLEYPDTYFEIDINPNRPDTMSVLGLARELAAYFEVSLREPDVVLDLQEPSSAVSVAIEDVVACPRFTAREVCNIVIGPSPHWLRARLIAAGVRPISNVVDASNYAMIEIGHPTHAFDADRLGDRIVVRRAHEGETIVTLDDIERELVSSDIVVTDGQRPVAIGGVMGGADTEVHDGTTRVVVEAAYWDPPSIMLTSKRLGLRSEASARFERGMDPDFCDVAADRVAQLLVEIAGGAAVAGLIDAYPEPIRPRHIELAAAEVTRVLGAAIPEQQVAAILTRTGFGVTGTDPMDVEVPTRRPDVSRPVDLIEDVARLYGYDNLPDRVATGLGGGLPAAEVQLRKVRRLLVGAGYSETLLFSFLGRADLDAMQLPADDPRRRGVGVVRPINEDEGVLRTTLLPGLLKAAAVNLGRHLAGARLFEIGSVFLAGEGKLPDQPSHLAFVGAGDVAGWWMEAASVPDVWDGLGLVRLLTESMRVPGVELLPSTAPGFHPGRCAEIRVEGETVGIVGEVLPSVAAGFGLKGRVMAGEMRLDALVREALPWNFDPPSTYPPAIFDLAFEVDAGVPAGAVLEAVDAAAGEVLERSDLFDVFSGDPVPPGRKSLAIRLTLRAPDRTLTDEEVGPIRREVVAQVSETTGASLRGEV